MGYRSLLNWLSDLGEKPRPKYSLVSFIDDNINLQHDVHWVMYAYIEIPKYNLVGLMPELMKERPSEVLFWTAYTFLHGDG